MESKEQKKFRSILEASGAVTPFDEVRFSAPSTNEAHFWQEQIFDVRSSYVKTKPRFGGIFNKKYWKELSQESTSVKDRNSEYKRAEIYTSFCIKYWVRRALNYKEDQKVAMEWNQKGNEFFYQGKYDEAIQCYDKAITIEQFVSSFWNNKGAALHDKGDIEQALNCYNIALKMDPNNAVALIGKAAVLHDLKQYDNVIECCDKAIGINPYLSSAWYNKALALDKLGKKKEVAFCLQKIVELEK